MPPPVLQEACLLVETALIDSCPAQPAGTLHTWGPTAACWALHPAMPLGSTRGPGSAVQWAPPREARGWDPVPTLPLTDRDHPRQIAQPT